MDLEKGRLETRMWHEKFVRLYHKDDPALMTNVYEKYDHTQRVVIEVRGLIEALQLEGRLAVIAELGALLHDIGRYKHLAEHETVTPANIFNPGEYSLAILEEEDAFHYLPADVIRSLKDVIAYHNSDYLPTSLDDETMLCLKMVRDADKLDVWRMFSMHYMIPIDERSRAMEHGLPEGDSVKQEIRNALTEGRAVVDCYIENLTELKMQQISWVYDLNFLWTAQVASRRRYVGKIADTLPDDSDLKVLAGQAILYLDSQAEKAQAEGFRGR